MTALHKHTTEFVHDYLSSLNCPKSLAVWLLFSNKEHQQLVDLECDPSAFNSNEDFRNAFLAVSLLKKSNFLDLEIDRKKVALDKFMDCENSCKETNRHLSDPYFFVKNGSESLVFQVIRKIEMILGDFDAEEWIDSCDWGPGVTTLNSKDTSGANKYHCEGGITAKLSNFVKPWFSTAYPLWFSEFPNWTVVDANKITTVPKNAKTDRVIAIEPGLNLWFQKGIGTMIRRRMLRSSIDLNTDRHNHRLSRLGSRFGTIATVDFSSASDTISKKTVEVLLPPTWFLIMDLCRSKHGVLNGQALTYEKFSSMGNGFTWELESLIFYAVAYVCTRHVGGDINSISVFGDDVVLPPEAFSLFVDLSKQLGFTTNLKKSFSQGYFRESCGQYYFDGRCCKPYFLKERVRNERDVYKTANSVRRVAHRHIDYGCDRRFLRCWQSLSKSKLIPKGKKLLISEGYGDGGLIVNFDEASPKPAKGGQEGFFSAHLTFVQRMYFCDHHGLLVSRVRRGSHDMSYRNDVPVKNRGQYKRKRVLIKQWYDLGPWL